MDTIHYILVLRQRMERIGDALVTFFVMKENEEGILRNFTIQYRLILYVKVGLLKPGTDIQMNYNLRVIVHFGAAEVIGIRLPIKEAVSAPKVCGVHI